MIANGATWERYERESPLLLERIEGELQSRVEWIRLRETFPSELQIGARFLDLGGSRPQIKTYLVELQKSFIFAVLTGLISATALILVSLDLNLAWNGNPNLLASRWTASLSKLVEAFSYFFTRLSSKVLMGMSIG